MENFKTSLKISKKINFQILIIFFISTLKDLFKSTQSSNNKKQKTAKNKKPVNKHKKGSEKHLKQFFFSNSSSPLRLLSSE
jgi:hypothetical protein